MLNPIEAGEDHIDIHSLPYETYSFDDIKLAWHSFAHQVKEQGKESVYAALKRRDPKIRGEHHYILEVDSQLMVDIISPLLNEFTQFIRKRVKNYHVMLELEVSSHDEEPITHLTGKDKFQRLARKNPSLHRLKSIFNLDIEY
jgi:DNA polymerase-3 subunit gamma/tau